jgi:serine/threonine protein kinase
MSPLYLQSPEVLKDQIIGEKADVWACGILLSILVSGFPPYQLDGNSNMMLKAVAEGQFDFESANWQDL